MPGHFIPALKPHTPGLQAGVEPRKKYSPSEGRPVCSDAWFQQRQGCLSHILGSPEGEATLALDPERMETLRLRRAGKRFCGFFTRIVRRTCCIERVLSHLGGVGEDNRPAGGGGGGMRGLCHLMPRFRALCPLRPMWPTDAHYSCPASGEHQLNR